MPFQALARYFDGVTSIMITGKEKSSVRVEVALEVSPPGTSVVNHDQDCGEKKNACVVQKYVSESNILTHKSLQKKIINLLL